MPTRVRVATIVAGAMLAWNAHAAPVPASATAIAQALYGVELFGGTVAGVVTLPDVTIPFTSGPVSIANPIGPVLATDCVVDATSCSFGGIVGGVAVAIDGIGALQNKLGGLGLILYFADGGSLTVTNVAAATPTTSDNGAEPAGIAAAVASISDPILDSEGSIALAVGESATFTVDAGFHSLVWAGAEVLVAAERHLAADVAEPVGLAALSLGSLILLRRRASTVG